MDLQPGNGGTIIAKQTAKEDPLSKIKTFLSTRENRYTDAYLNSLYHNCNKDIHYVRLYVAISGQESSFGTKGHANDGKGTDVNYIGWMYWPNGRRAIRDYETVDQFTKHICSRFTNNYFYHGQRIINRKGNIHSWNNVKTYAGNDRYIAWGNNVQAFYKAMM